MGSEAWNATIPRCGLRCGLGFKAVRFYYLITKT